MTSRRLFALLPLCAVPAALAAQPPLAATRPRAQPGDLPGVRVLDRARGLVFRVYYDSLGRAAARAALPRLADIYAAVAQEVGADPGRVEFAAVAFVGDTAYVPPRTAGEVRWTVVVDSAGRLGARGEHDLYVVLPHEQVHAVQELAGATLPRWYAEGQAEWAGLRVTRRWRPALADAERAEKLGAYAGTPRRLGAWGGMTVKREALLRQMTPEQRARFARDSTHTPPGPWKLGPGDLVSDESQTVARYGAALALFEDLERARGAATLTRMFAALWDGAGPATPDALAAGIQARTGVDVAARLR